MTVLCQPGNLLTVHPPEVWVQWGWASEPQVILLQHVVWDSTLKNTVPANGHLSPKRLLGRWQAG